MMMEMILICILAFALGLLFSYIRSKFLTKGTLIVNQTDPEKDIYRLVIDDLDSLTKSKRIILKIKTELSSSQE